MAATSTAPSPITKAPTAAKFTLLSMSAPLLHSFDIAAPGGILLRRAAAGGVEERPDVRVLQGRQFGHRADSTHLAAADDGDPVGDLPEQVEIVRDDHHRQSQQVSQVSN